LTLDHNYKTFLSIVADGRSLPFERVEKIAQGKVYAGTAALDEGLIDKLGTHSQAIRSAAEHAGLEDYATTILSTPLSFKDRLLQRISAGAAALFPKGSALETFLKYLPAHLPALNRTQLFKDPNSIYAHCMIQYN
ncbi:MAG: S49 family peptidase, partial [Deltaproteobacteria bacterium]|nr:S49 family peptidase [Deltaproteobacteria bacterium]